MNSETQKTLLAICDELETLLARAVPAADPERLARIRFVCARLACEGTYIGEKAGNIASRAERYLSARKHQKEPGGADGLMHDMRYSLLQRIRDEINQRARNGVGE